MIAAPGAIHSGGNHECGVYQLHAIGGFLFLALWPFTRLVHVWSAPLAYLWRPYVVYRARRGTVPPAQPAPAAVRDAPMRRNVSSAG
ncbi:respiratory nitrate reductase subunit gamma [Microtetraspora fusca]|uniref:respiratory nitrate reductase subunit gamma n=1 Tax=Microtetraspora fusca TaxID=1997 RepID=UPI0008309355